MVSSPRWRSALIGSAIEARRAGVGVGWTSTMVAISAMAIRADTPKNGPRQLIPPSSPPSSGPMAMPMPRAVS